MANQTWGFDKDDYELIPRDTYRPIMLDALPKIVCLDDNPSDVVAMLFSEEELLWLKSQMSAKSRT